MSELVLRGGDVFDPELGRFETRDVKVSGGVIVADTHPTSGDERVVDVAGLIVTPGLVDSHVHVFRGQDLGLDPDEIGLAGGTTTMIDAGSAGAHLFGAFRSTTIDAARVRVRAFVNIASVGTTSIRLGGELKALHYSDEQVAIDCVEANRDVVLGVKVRASHDVAGGNAVEAMARARRVADAVNLPLMVHLGPAPASIDEILATLSAGDIITHAFTGFEGNGVIDGGRVRASVRAARDRGVLFDIGHGASGFGSRVAQTAIAEGFLPDSISSDLHAYSLQRVVSLPQVLSKLMALGMSMDEVLTRATLAPSRTLGLEPLGVGTLRPGAPGDLAVFALDEGPRTFQDGFGESFAAEGELVPVLTVIGGDVVDSRPENSGAAR